MCGVKIFVIMTLVVSLTLATRMDPDRDVRKESERQKDGTKMGEPNKDEVRSNDIEVKKHLGEWDLRRQPFRKANLMPTIDGAPRNDVEAKNERSVAEFANHSVDEADKTPSEGKRLKNEDPIIPAATLYPTLDIRYRRRYYRCPSNVRAYAACYLGFRYGCYKKCCWSTRMSQENLRKDASWDYWLTNTSKEYIECESARDCRRYWRGRERILEYKFEQYYGRLDDRTHPCFDDWTSYPCFKGHRYGCHRKLCWVQDFMQWHGWRYSIETCDTTSDCGIKLWETDIAAFQYEHLL